MTREPNGSIRFENESIWIQTRYSVVQTRLWSMSTDTLIDKNKKKPIRYDALQHLIHLNMTVRLN